MWFLKTRPFFSFPKKSLKSNCPYKTERRRKITSDSTANRERTGHKTGLHQRKKAVKKTSSKSD